MVEDKEFEKREELATNYEKNMRTGHQRKAKKYLRELEIYDKRVRSKMSASIDTSQDGVYILEYNTPFQRAFAIIPAY